MNSTLTYNIGKVVFDTKLLTRDWDTTSFSFGDIWITETDLFKESDFTLNVVVNNLNDVVKNVYLLIYADDSSYYGLTPIVGINPNSGYTFTFTDQVSTSGWKIIRIEATIDGINYISTELDIYVYSDLRELTDTDLRDLTDSDYRATV